MTQRTPIGNTTLAPLTNVALCLAALERAMGRQQHLPGLVMFYGPSGWGKSMAAAHAANVHRAYCIQAKSTWTKKWVLASILSEMGVAPARTIPEMADQVAEQLSLSGRPLIVDEVDHLVDRNLVEIIRDIYEGSNAAILLIGEELLPIKIKRWERLHGRIIDFVAAQPADLEDAAHLRKFYVKRVRIKDDLLEFVHAHAHGSVRRICVNLARLEEEALKEGKKEIDLEWWGSRALFTGEAPKRRV
jgi:DNA transposition AAA+ family ATPase